MDKCERLLLPFLKGDYFKETGSGFSGTISFPNGGYLQKQDFAPSESKSLLLQVAPCDKGDKYFQD